MQQNEVYQVVDPDGLVIIPPAKAGGPAQLVRWTVMIVFCLVIFGTLVVDLLAPAPPIKLLGAEHAQDVHLRTVAKLSDGSRFRLLEHDLRLRSRIRRWATDQYGWVLYRWFGHAQRALVVGDGGWLFLRSRIEIPDEMESGFLARRAGATVAALDRRLATFGLASVVVPVPRKAALLGDRLPRYLDPRPDVDQLIIADLKQRGVPNVDLWSAFADELEEPPYHLLGSHWTDEAQFVAAKKVGEQSGRMNSKAQRSTTVERTQPGQNAGETDLLAFGGLMDRARLPIASDRQSLIVRDEHNTPVSNVVPVPGRVVLVGTSFSAGRRFPSFLTHFFETPVFNWSKPGSFPGKTLAEFIRGQAWQDATEVVVLETPNHHLIQDPIGRLLEPLFALPPAKPLVSHLLVDEELFSTVAGFGGGVAKGRGARIADSGRLAHTGDGVVGVRVRGHVKQNVLLQIAPVGGEPVKVMWRPGTNQVVLPIISVIPSASAVWFAMTPTSVDSSATTIVVKSIDFVSEVRPQPRIDLVTPKPSARDDGWEVVIDGPDNVLSATATLEVELDVKGAFEGDVLVEVRTLGKAEPLAAEWTKLRKQSLVVMSLARFADLTIDQVRIAGSGAPPRKLLKRAVLRTGQTPDPGSPDGRAWVEIPVQQMSQGDLE